MVQNSRGQSTVEFIVSFSSVFLFIFFFIKLSFNYTEGFLIHYSTFMASRSYLVQDNGRNDMSDPRRIFNFFTPNDSHAASRLKSISEEGIFRGLYYDFEQKFSPSNIIGGSGSMKLTSESYIGKEPTAQECISRICAILGNSGPNCNTFKTFADNGC